jgi:hypothetical protein
MTSETAKAMKSEGSVNRRAITLVVLIVVVLAAIIAWLLGFFGWLLS